jgi:tRNA A-37 threonylcarbamoyl transferase component Bud32
MIDRDSEPAFPEDDPLDAGLRAAFRPETTSDPWGGSVLTALRESSGPTPIIRLWDEPDEGPTGVVQPRSPEAAEVASGPGRAGGRYEVAGELARGGIGVVLKGRDRDLGREVALKVLRAEHVANPSMVRRLLEEAQIGGQLQHPGILPVYELGLDAAWRPFFTMKLVRGRTLAALLDERGEPSRDRRRFLAIFEQVAQTIAYAHARGVIHRDLKPSNVMVGAFGEVQVVDWGLAKVLARADDPDSEAGAVATIRGGGSSDSRSEAGSVLGTPAYMAPEQARGEVEALDERSDVFALGALLCEILTGRPPYQGTRDEILRQARAGSLADAFDRLDACGADAELVGIARRCLEPAPEARLREAGRVSRAITAHLASAEERARAAERDAATAVAVAGSERRARRLTVALAGSILAALLTVGGGSLWVTREQVRAANAQLLAERETVRAEREHTARIEGALEVLFATEQKGQLLILQAADVAGRDAGRWADLLAACRAIAERVALTTPDQAARRRARDLADRLRAKEVALRQRAEK